MNHFISEDNELLLESILREENIVTMFQPIISLTKGDVLGYEALSRGPAGSNLERADLLFDAARQFNLTWDLEYLCRKKAIQRAKDKIGDKLLFLNVDPQVINDARFVKGATKNYLSDNHIDASRIIFEITERTCIEDYKSFRCVVDNYIEQGYHVAVDDVGAGYSGLRMLAEINPAFMKIDMELIRGIDKKIINQILIKTLNDFAKATNMRIIAEGIETIEELDTLISLGVDYGQGYYIQKPQKEICSMPSEIKGMVCRRSKENKGLLLVRQTLCS